MVQIKKNEGQVEIKSNADRFFDAWAHKAHQAPKICPDKLPKVELHEGDWHSVGAVIAWDYIIDGKHEFIKTKTEEVDEERRVVKYNYLEGDLVRRGYYKNFKSKIEVIPKEEDGENGEMRSIVKWSFEYEKTKEDAPELDMYVDFMLSCFIAIDACLCNA